MAHSEKCRGCMFENACDYINCRITNKSNPKHPCISCVYFYTCGETTRIVPCRERITKSERKKQLKKILKR